MFDHFYLHLLFAWFFFMFFLCHFALDELMVEAISFAVVISWAHVKTLFFNNFIFTTTFKRVCCQMNRNIAFSGRISFNIFCTGEQSPLLPPNGKQMSMFDLHWRASKFNEYKGRCLCQKTILIVNITRQLQGKNEKNLKNKEIQKIAAKRYCLRYSFYHLEVASLKFDEWI